MRKILLFISLVFLSVHLNGQVDSLLLSKDQKSSPEFAASKVTIYPVPLREGPLTIKSDREIAEIRITNIIGRDILKEHYDIPVNFIKINIDNQGRGIYLCTLVFRDGTRTTRKIMVENTR